MKIYEVENKKLCRLADVMYELLTLGKEIKSKERFLADVIQSKTVYFEHTKSEVYKKYASQFGYLFETIPSGLYEIIEWQYVPLDEYKTIECQKVTPLFTALPLPDGDRNISDEKPNIMVTRIGNDAYSFNIYLTRAVMSFKETGEILYKSSITPDFESCYISTGDASLLLGKNITSQEIISLVVQTAPADGKEVFCHEDENKYDRTRLSPQTKKMLDNRLRIIAALVDYMTTSSPSKEQPIFKNKTQLINEIVELYGDYDGLSKNTLEETIRKGKKLLK